MSHRIALKQKRARTRPQQACSSTNSGVELVDRPWAAEGPFQILTTRANDGICVAPTGKLDMTTAGQLTECLERALEDDRVERIVVDLRGVTALTPVALTALLIAHRRAYDDHRELLLIRGPRPVQQAIDRVDGPFCYFP